MAATKIWATGGGTAGSLAVDGAGDNYLTVDAGHWISLTGPARYRVIPYPAPPPPACAPADPVLATPKQKFTGPKTVVLRSVDPAGCTLTYVAF